MARRVPCSPAIHAATPAGCLVSSIAHFLTADIPVAVLFVLGGSATLAVTGNSRGHMLIIQP